MSFTSQAMIFPALLRPYVAHVAHLTHVFYLWVPRDHRKKIWFRPKGDVVQLPNGTLWMYYFGGAKFVGPRFTRDVERFLKKKTCWTMKKVGKSNSTEIESRSMLHVAGQRKRYFEGLMFWVIDVLFWQPTTLIIDNCHMLGVHSQVFCCCLWAQCGQKLLWLSILS